MAYRVKQSDRQWAREMIRTSKDNALFRFPSSDLVYRHTKNPLELILVSGNENDETHLRTIAVFREVGCKVVVKKEARHKVIEEVLDLVGKQVLISQEGMEDLVKLRQAHQNN
jgi:hypothetical protein